MADRMIDKPWPTVTNERIAAAQVELAKANRRIEECRGPLSEALSIKRDVLKRLKADGINIDALQDAMRIKDMPDAEARRWMRDRVTYSLVMAPDLPVAQGDLFDTAFDVSLSDKEGEDLNTWNANEMGYRAGLEGGSSDDCPFPQGTPYFAAYHEGYHDGQAVIARRMGDNAQEGGAVVASIARRKPERSAA
jgi:ribosome modulation factor